MKYSKYNNILNGKALHEYLAEGELAYYAEVAEADPLDSELGNYVNSLSPAEYEEFLSKIADEMEAQALLMTLSNDIYDIAEKLMNKV